MPLLRLLCTTALTIFSCLAFSQERDPAALPLNIKPPKKPRPFTLGFRETFYLAEKSSLLGEKHFEEVTLRVRGQGNSDFVSAGIDIGASYGLNVPDYLSIFAPEAYFRFMLGETPSANSSMMTFGRKKDRWSLLDSYWELGVWQPLYKWDYLRPEEQGLTGAFLEIPFSEARVLFFATPLFVPESGANYRLKNKKLVSANPWFFEPTEQLLIINNTATDVQYEPHIPPIEEIVINGAGGATFEVGARTAGTWGRLSYIFKPRNQIALPFEGILQLTAGTTYVDVDIYPQVIYHHLGAADVGYKTENFSVWLTALHDSPVEEEFPANRTYQILNPATFISPGAEFSEVSESGIGYGFVASYLAKLKGEDPSEAGPNSSSNNPVFGNPYNFNNAFRGSVKVSMPLINGYRSSAGVQYTQSFADDAAWLKFTSELTFSDKLRAQFEADLLGSLAPRGNNHFLSRYRGNDRILALVNYIF